MNSSSSPPLKKLTLLVEPDADDAFLIRWAFQKLGIFHPIYAVQTAAEAIEYLLGAGKFQHRAAFPSPSLVILDLCLPDLPGLDLLQQIRAKPAFASLPIIVFTSGRACSEARRAEHLGATACFLKPTDPDLFCDFIKSIRQHWLES